jgi:phosphate acetyltransferase
MSFEQSVIQRARRVKAAVVLPEIWDTRIVDAGFIALERGLAGSVVFLGTEEERDRIAHEKGDLPSGMQVLDHLSDSRRGQLAETYYELRRRKGISRQDAGEAVRNPLVYGALMVKSGHADGMVAGAATTSGEVIRTALTIIGMQSGIRWLSTCSLLIGLNPKYGEKGELVTADPGMNPDPTPEQLADIAIASADTSKHVLGNEPRVAMLSFSTKGSGKHEKVDKVVEALRLAREKRPDLNLDGEMQIDSALIPDVAKKKCPDSTVAGRANVLVYPDLNAANIGVKSIERFGGGQMLGPIMQGLSRAMNDLSRGSSTEDIANVIAVTAVQHARLAETG